MRLLILVLVTSVIPPLCFAESAPDAAPATSKKSLYDKSHSINAVEFGLPADSSVDQTSTLAKVIQHASNTQNIDTVYVPKGTYYIAKAISLRPGVNLIGEGPGKTVFVRKNAKKLSRARKECGFWRGCRRQPDA